MNPTSIQFASVQFAQPTAPIADSGSQAPPPFLACGSSLGFFLGLVERAEHVAQLRAQHGELHARVGVERRRLPDETAADQDGLIPARVVTVVARPILGMGEIAAQHARAGHRLGAGGHQVLQRLGVGAVARRRALGLDQLLGKPSRDGRGQPPAIAPAHIRDALHGFWGGERFHELQFARPVHVLRVVLLLFRYLQRAAGDALLLEVARYRARRVVHGNPLGSSLTNPRGKVDGFGLYFVGILVAFASKAVTHGLSLSGG